MEIFIVSDLPKLEPYELGKACLERPLDELVKELQELPWPEPGKPVVSPASTFSITSGAMRVTDPCMSLDCDLLGIGAGTVNGVKNGQWQAYVESEHRESDIKAGKHWHQKRIDMALKTMSENEGYPLVRHLMASDFCEAIRTYKQRTEVCGPLNYLHIQHSDYRGEEPFSLGNCELLSFRVASDSGLVGFFDLTWLESQHPVESDAPLSTDTLFGHRNHPAWKAFYRKICDMTPETTLFGTCEDAVAAYGSNLTFRCYIKRDEAGEVVCARIVFNCDII
jgi:hypothetical protein